MTHLDEILRDVLEEDVAANAGRPFPPMPERRLPAKPFWVNIGRAMTAAGVAGLLWLSSLVQNPHPLSVVIQRTAPTGEGFLIAMEVSSDFVKIALTNERRTRTMEE